MHRGTSKSDLVTSVPQKLIPFSHIYSFLSREEQSEALARAQSSKDWFWAAWELTGIGDKVKTREKAENIRESRAGSCFPWERKLNRRTPEDLQLVCWSWDAESGRDQVKNLNRNSCWLPLPALGGKNHLYTFGGTIPFDPYACKNHYCLPHSHRWTSPSDPLV
jgi:hypothetical protein